MEKDLLPAARKHGHLTAYVNLWDARKHPTPALIAALTLALEPKGMAKSRCSYRPELNLSTGTRIEDDVGCGSSETGEQLLVCGETPRKKDAPPRRSQRAGWVGLVQTGDFSHPSGRFFAYAVTRRRSSGAREDLNVAGAV